MQVTIAWAGTLIRLVPVAGTARQAPARGRLDGQDGQGAVDDVVLRRPGPQGLDDVGDVIHAGVRLPVSLPAARSVQLHLEARRVLALSESASGRPRRRSGRPAESCAARFTRRSAQPAGVVIYAKSLPVIPWRKGCPPVARGKAVPVNTTTARHRSNTRRPRTVRSNSVRSTRDALPHWDYSSQFQRKRVVSAITPRVPPRMAGGSCALVTTGAGLSIEQCLRHISPYVVRVPVITGNS